MLYTTKPFESISCRETVYLFLPLFTGKWRDMGARSSGFRWALPNRPKWRAQEPPITRKWFSYFLCKIFFGSPWVSHIAGYNTGSVRLLNKLYSVLVHLPNWRNGSWRTWNSAAAQSLTVQRPNCWQCSCPTIGTAAVKLKTVQTKDTRYRRPDTVAAVRYWQLSSCLFNSCVSVDGSTLRRLTVQLSINLFNGYPSAGTATLLLSIMAAVQFSNSLSPVDFTATQFLTTQLFICLFSGCQIVDTAPV
jgi:hypothetical protein